MFCATRASPRVGVFLPFADLVVIAEEFHPIPFRTRPLKPSASMVLRPKPRESRTLPGLPRAEKQNPPSQLKKSPGRESVRGFCFYSAHRPLAQAISTALSLANRSSRERSTGSLPTAATRSRMLLTREQSRWHFLCSKDAQSLSACSSARLAMKPAMA